MDRFDRMNVLRAMRRDSRVAGVVAVFVASLAMNVIQGQQLRELRSADRVRPEIGSRMPAMSVTTLGGEPATLHYDDRRPTILYYFSPTCQWCEYNWAGVTTLAGATSRRYRFVAVSTARAVQPSVIRHALTFEVYGGLADDARRAAGLGGTPHLIVVSADGRVQNAWTGAFRGRVKEEIETYFGLALPELAAPSSKP